MAARLSTADLPAEIRLTPTFDADRMLGDLQTLQDRAWLPEEPYVFESFFGSETKVYHDGKWTGMSLRAQGGRADRTDPGGPGLDEFADTPLLPRVPYLTDVLQRIGSPLRSARLLRLPPGGVIGEHRDTYHGFEYGQLRLHAPITTNPRVENIIRGQRCTWAPGELWYGDFGSLHSGQNNGETDRVHLVVDVAITPALLDLFPDAIAAKARTLDILFHEEPLSLSTRELSALQCAFALPSTLVRGIFDIDDGIAAEMAARLVMRGERLFFSVEDRDLFALRPLAGNRLAFAGWTTERYLQYEYAQGAVTSVALVLRRGQEETRIVFPVRHTSVPEVEVEMEARRAAAAR
jgi:aspartate beta-hydroxylase